MRDLKPKMCHGKKKQVGWIQILFKNFLLDWFTKQDWISQRKTKRNIKYESGISIYIVDDDIISKMIS